MNLRQYTGARPLLQMAAQGRTADLISGRFQTAPRRALSEKLTQGGQHPNRRRSGMAATLLRRGRAEIDNCRDEVQKPKIQHLLPCLTPQTWSFQTDNAPHQGCITAIPSNPSARDPTTHGISGNCLLSPCRTMTKSAGLAPSCIIRARLGGTDLQQAWPADRDVDANTLVSLSEWLRSQNLDVHSLLVIKDDKLIFERY